MSNAFRWVGILAVAIGVTSCGGSGSTGASSTSNTGTSSATGSSTTAAVGSIAVSPGSNTLSPGDTFQIASTLKDASGATLANQSVQWTSSNTAVLTVSTTGLVKAVAPGSATVTASSEGKTASVAVTVTDTSASTTVVKVDASKTEGAVKDLLGVNRKPSDSAQSGTQSWDGTALYQAFGVSQVRLHDSGIDLCSIYKAATKLNAGVTPQTPVVGCTLTPSGGVPHFMWTPTSSADADLNNPDNYDFSAADEAVQKSLAAGAKIYLGLAQNYNGPNDTTDPVAWAKVATNVYKHVIGTFKPTAGIAVNPVFVEIHNEPDGGFWRGSTTTFNTLYTEINQRVRAAAAASGKTLKIGGPGFTRDILSNARQSGNPANGFVSAVGASSLDFYSAHMYDTCATAKLSTGATFLRSLRSLADSQGATGKPLHISEWNIGLGSQCGNDFYSEPRMQSYAAGVLTLMQDPAQNIEAAHFYAGMPIMGLLDFTSASGAVRVNPSAWSFWAHAKLKGATLSDTQICTKTGACVKGYASESAAVQALAAQSGGAHQVVVSNDSSTSVTYTLQFSGLTGSTATVVISKPPGSAQDLAVSGNPSAASSSAIANLLASVSTDTRASLGVVGGQLSVTLTLPAYSVQHVELR